MFSFFNFKSNLLYTVSDRLEDDTWALNKHSILFDSIKDAWTKARK